MRKVSLVEVGAHVELAVVLKRIACGETTAGVIQEMYALSLTHFVIRSLMFEAATSIGLDSDRLSFTRCFQILQCRLPECDTRTPESFQAWYEGLFWEMQGNLE